MHLLYKQRQLIQDPDPNDMKSRIRIRADSKSFRSARVMSSIVIGKAMAQDLDPNDLKSRTRIRKKSSGAARLILFTVSKKGN
jgi:hypothetical protein